MQLLNFQVRGTAIELSGQTFELHHQFALQGYSYHTPKRIFTLAFERLLAHGAPQAEPAIKTTLSLIFRDVTFLRIQDTPFDEQNVCFNTMQFVDELLKKAERSQPNVVVQMAELFTSDEWPASEWHNYLYIGFVWGVEMLIAAATVEASI